MQINSDSDSLKLRMSRNMIKATILTVGDEILIGQIIDTNSAWLGRHLSDLGIRVNRIVSLSDDHSEIVNGISSAWQDHDIIFITGGLGPTKDDITKKAIADFLNVKLFFHQPTFDRIKAMFEKLGRELSPNHHDQCLMPEGVTILYNKMGTAPGMLFERDGKLLISMPGVPYEMYSIMEMVVLPMLRERYVNLYIVHHTILTACTGETTIENNISDILAEMPDYIKVAYLPSLAAVRVRLSASGSDQFEIDKNIQYYKNLIVERLGDIVYGYDESSLEEELLNIFRSRGLTLSTAESCSGGAIASKIVSVPGSSAYYIGSTIAYTNDVKIDQLGVHSTTIEKHGAVSEETVIEMAMGCIKKFNSDIAIAVSGIAGPDGGSPDKPVGTIWMCVASKNHHHTYLLRCGKDRKKNIEIATIYGLDQVRRFVVNIEPKF